jgi:hypothetical protein
LEHHPTRPFVDAIVLLAEEIGEDAHAAAAGS